MMGGIHRRLEVLSAATGRHAIQVATREPALSRLPTRQRAIVNRAQFRRGSGWFAWITLLPESIFPNVESTANTASAVSLGELVWRPRQ
jgi:hypothetical protein